MGRLTGTGHEKPQKRLLSLGSGEKKRGFPRWEIHQRLGVQYRKVIYFLVHWSSIMKWMEVLWKEHHWSLISMVHFPLPAMFDDTGGYTWYITGRGPPVGVENHGNSQLEGWEKLRNIMENIMLLHHKKKAPEYFGHLSIAATGSGNWWMCCFGGFVSLETYIY